MISINQLSVHFTGEFIFDDISFIINDSDKIGLVGKNGAGKTTLLKIIAGDIEPEKGSISFPSGQICGYLPQELDLKSEKTVIEETLLAFDRVNIANENIEKFSKEIGQRTDYESEEYSKLIEKLHNAHYEYDILGGATARADSEKILLGLGFNSSDFNRKMNEFSGGWQMRVELAKILLKKPDLVLLDEPTNHLDIESIQWLENFLYSYSKAVILVSHDRAFLDKITNRTIEISLGKIFDYKASYSNYVQMRQERIEQQVATYSNQQKQVEQIESFIEKFRYKSTKARQVQSRVKMLEKMDRIEIDELDTSSIHFKFPPAPHSGKTIVEIEDLGKKYDSKIIFSNVNFSINKGEKIAFVGRNGEGKTTLSKIIMGQIDYTGKLKLGHLVKIGYYAQNQAELLNMEKTVFETIDDVAVGEMRTKVRSLLGSFLFSGDTIDKKVKVLSGGEKARLAMAKLLLEPVNLLILDEPTNHLDMRSKDILKNALLKYDGGLIIVSHDRDFLQGLTSRVFEFKNGIVKQYIGDIYDFLDFRKLSNLKELEISKKKNIEKDIIKPENNGFFEKKEMEKQRRKINSLIEQSEKKIEKFDSEIAELDNILANVDKNIDVVNNQDIWKKYQELKDKQSLELNIWEELHKNLGDLD